MGLLNCADSARPHLIHILHAAMRPTTYGVTGEHKLDNGAGTGVKIQRIIIQNTDEHPKTTAEKWHVQTV